MIAFSFPLLCDWWFGLVFAAIPREWRGGFVGGLKESRISTCVGMQEGGGINVRENGEKNVDGQMKKGGVSFE